MAKKITPPKIQTGQVYDRANDVMQTRIYALHNGKWKRATDKEKKNFLKSELDKEESKRKIDFNELPKEDRNYIKKVQVGRKTAKQKIRIDGKFVNHELFENPNSPILFHDIARKEGKTIPQLFESNPALYEVAKAYAKSKDGMPMQYHSWNITNRLDTFGGKIFINGKETTKLKALFKVDNVDKKIIRKFKNHVNEYYASYRNGFTELHITIPTESEINEAQGPEDLEEFGVYVIGSKTMYEQLEQDREKWSKKEVPEDRYLYEFKIRAKKGRKYMVKYGEVNGRNELEARENIFAQYPGCIIIYCRRIPKH